MHNSNSMKKFKNLTVLINQATPQVCLAYLTSYKNHRCQASMYSRVQLIIRPTIQDIGIDPLTYLIAFDTNKQPFRCIKKPKEQKLFGLNTQNKTIQGTSAMRKRKYHTKQKKQHKKKINDT